MGQVLTGNVLVCEQASQFQAEPELLRHQSATGAATRKLASAGTVLTRFACTVLERSRAISAAFFAALCGMRQSTSGE